MGDKDVLMNGSTATVSLDRYTELLDTEMWVEALDSAGVDNWSGYDEALEIFQEMQE